MIKVLGGLLGRGELEGPTDTIFKDERRFALRIHDLKLEAKKIKLNKIRKTIINFIDQLSEGKMNQNPKSCQR